jgi:mevalonate kinase
MINDEICSLIDQYRDVALGWKLSGAGGGGYIIVVSETPIPDAVRISIRRGME